MTAMFELSSDASALASVLREIKIGELIAYDRLSGAIGRDVRHGARPALVTARQIVMRENRMVFDAVRRVGLIRLSDGEIVSLGDRARSHIRRTVRKTARAITCVEYDAMTREQQVKHNASLSLLGALGEMATDKASARIERKVSADLTQLPAAKAAVEALG